MSAAKKLLTEREVEAEYGLLAKTLRQWRYRGVGPAYVKVSGNCVRYRVAAIEKWLDQRTVGAA